MNVAFTSLKVRQANGYSQSGAVSKYSIVLGCCSEFKLCGEVGIGWDAIALIQLNFSTEFYASQPMKFF